MQEVAMNICAYILENINDEITMNQIVENFYYNKFYLIRIFKMYTGYTIKEFINCVKVLKTINPLIFTNDTILKIALNNGFNSQEYYSEKFKDVIGISPLNFRTEYSNIDNISDVNELKTKKNYLLYLYQWQQDLLNMSTELKYNDTKTKKLEKYKIY